ncbi:MAG: hypothetical protein II915_03850 [Eubacterium sp.]|nr:hypothetical protein [Eubacterium sp.]
MKKKSLFRIIYVVVLMCFFTGIGITIAVKPQTDYSRNENRYLEKLPALTWDSYKSGEFGEQFDKAVTDQFPFRDFFTGMSTNYRKLMGFHDVGDVYLGKDHYYFDKKLEKDMALDACTTAIGAVKAFADTFHAEEPTADAVAEVETAQTDGAADAGAESGDGAETASTTGRATFKDIKVMLIPSPASVLKDDLPMFARIYDDEPYFEAAKSVFGEDFIDVREAFRAAVMAGTGDGTSDGAGDGTTDQSADDSPYLYFRTDHHWTHLGAYEAYKVFEESMGRTPIPYDSFNYKKVSDSFYGTMFSRALDNGAVPDSIEIPEVPGNPIVKAGEDEIPLYDMEKLDEKDHYAIYFGGNYPVVTIKNPHRSEEKKLLVFKDSFANSFVPLLINEYSEITMIDPRYETRPMTMVMNTYKPDDVLVLFEMSNFVNTKEVLRLSMA